MVTPTPNALRLRRLAGSLVELGAAALLFLGFALLFTLVMIGPDPEDDGLRRGAVVRFLRRAPDARRPHASGSVGPAFGPAR